jgi:hypothetical protein
VSEHRARHRQPAREHPTCGGFMARPDRRNHGGMSQLTRRRDPDVAPRDLAHLLRDLLAGTIAQCVGNPGAAPMWQWRCGFYPGSMPGECTGGTAASFDQARADFEAAWWHVPREAHAATLRHGESSAPGRAGDTRCRTGAADANGGLPVAMPFCAAAIDIGGH